MKSIIGSEIPDRTSSLKAEISKRRLVLKESKVDLKRKLSEVSFEASSLEYTKLRMDYLEAEVDGGLLLFLAGLQKRLEISSSGVSSIVPTVWLEGCPNKESAPRLWTDLDRVCTGFLWIIGILLLLQEVICWADR